MAAIWDTTNNRWAPSMMTPVTSTIGTMTCNRFSWTGTSTKFTPSYNEVHMGLQRPDTFLITPTFSSGSIFVGPISGLHHPFSQRYNAVNINAVSEKSILMLQWMLNFENFRDVGGYAGDVMRGAPRYKALNDSPKSSGGNKPKGNWTRVKKTNLEPNMNRGIGDEL